MTLWVRADGPYGEIRMDYRRYPILLLAAGGVGITPVIGIVKDVYRVGDIPSSDRQAKKSHCIEDIWLLWCMPSFEVYHWFKEEIEACLNVAGTNGLPALHVIACITREEALPGEAEAVMAATSKLVAARPANGRSGVTFEAGRPDLSSLFPRMLAPSDLTQPSPNAEANARAITTFVCGPTALVNELWDAAAENARNGLRVDFHHETFDF